MFNAIEPLAYFGKLRLGFALQMLDLRRNLGDRGAGFGLRCTKTWLGVSEAAACIASTFAFRERSSSAIFCTVRLVSAFSALSR